MCESLSKLFFRWYPNDKKRAPTRQGRYLRKALLLACALHVGLFFFSFAVVGFSAMIMNLVEAAWSYSCYLTLRERAILFYMVLLLIGFCLNVASLCKDELGNLQILGKFINLIVSVLLGYIIGRGYYQFRKTGGLHGHGPTENLLEDTIIDKAAAAVDACGKKIGELVD